MLRLFARFIAAMILFAGIYLLYTNTTQTSLAQFNKKEIIFVNLANIPEIILPSKEENAGYQYELLIKYLDSLNKQKVEFNDSNFDLKIFYSKDVCERCIVINNQDMLLISNDYDNEENDVEIIETFQRSLTDNALLKNYKISYLNNDLDDLIYNLSNNLISHTIITRSSYLFYKKYYPNLSIKKVIGNTNLLWKFSTDDGSLQNNLFKFLELSETSSFIANLNNKYYSKNSISSYIFIGSRIFVSDMITKLPVYESRFKKAASMNDLDWKLLAAISYQESKWNNNAISPTGVKGLMMLTKSTADMLGVNRLIPDESIIGASRYLKKLSEKYAEFDEDTKVSLTLGAYNLGPGHISDIIKLSILDNKSLEDWNTLKIYLLKLNKKQFYKQMKYGYARGWEAVQYIENVKQYYDIISFLEEKDNKTDNKILNEVPKTL
jgi:membrane-bound lytic murein transglycosylase MltF